MDIYKTFIKNTSLFFISALVANLSLFVANVWLARVLNQVDYAILVLLTSVVGLFVVIANFGISDSCTKFIAAEKDKNALGRMVSSGLSICLVFSLVAATVLFFFAGFITKLVFKENVLFYVRLSSIWILCYAGIVFIKAVSLGLHRMLFAVLGDILYNPLKLVYLTLIIFWGITLRRIIIGWSVLAIAGFFGLLLYFIYKLATEGIRIRMPSFFNCGKIIKYGIFLYLPFVSVYLINYYLTIQLGIFSSKEQVSFFAVSMSLVSVSFLLFIPFSKILMPTVSRIYTSENQPKIEIIGRVLIKYIGITSFFMTSVFCYWSGRLIGFIYGPSYTPASFVLFLLSLGIFFEAFKFVSEPILNGTEHARDVSYVEVVKLLIVTIAMFCLVKRYGAEGAAWSFLGGAVVSCVAKLYLLKKRLNINLWREFAKIAILLLVLLFLLWAGVQFVLFIFVALVMVMLLRFFSIKEFKAIYAIIRG